MPSSHRYPTPDTCISSLPNSVLNDFKSANSHSLKIHQSQAGQQVCLVLTMDLVSICVWYISETRIPDSSNAIQQTAPTVSLILFLGISGDETVQTVNERGAGIVLRKEAEAVFSDWIPVNSRSCTVNLQGSIRVREDRCV